MLLLLSFGLAHAADLPVVHEAGVVELYVGDTALAFDAETGEPAGARLLPGSTPRPERPRTRDGWAHELVVDGVRVRVGEAGVVVTEADGIERCRSVSLEGLHSGLLLADDASRQPHPRHGLHQVLAQHPSGRRRVRGRGRAR